jgi:hypothetical protein
VACLWPRGDPPPPSTVGRRLQLHGGVRPVHLAGRRADRVRLLHLLAGPLLRQDRGARQRCGRRDCGWWDAHRACVWGLHGVLSVRVGGDEGGESKNRPRRRGERGAAFLKVFVDVADPLQPSWTRTPSCRQACGGWPRTGRTPSTASCSASPAGPPLDLSHLPGCSSRGFFSCWVWAELVGRSVPSSLVAPRPTMVISSLSYDDL